MKGLQKFFSVFLCILLCIGMITPLLADDTVTDAAAAVEPLEGISGYTKWSYASAADVKAANIAMNDPMKDAVYEYTEKNGDGCVRIKYENGEKAKNHGNYRIMMYCTSEGLFTADKYYVVAVYMTTSAEKNVLKLYNTADVKNEFVLADDTSVSGGEWRATAPVMIDGKIVTERLNIKGKNVGIRWDNTSADAELYIRELVYFTSEADAKLYTSRINPAVTDGGAEAEVDAKAEEAARKKRLLAMLIGAMGMRFGSGEDEVTLTSAFENVTDYQILDFSNTDTFSRSVLGLQTVTASSGKKESSVPIAFGYKKGIECVKVKYSPTTGNGAYHLATGGVKDSRGYRYNADYKYAVLTYLTTSTESRSLKYEHGAGKDAVVFSTDTSVDAGKWVSAVAHTVDGEGNTVIDTLDVPTPGKDQSISGRLSTSGSAVILRWYDNSNNKQVTDADSELFVREIVFFKTEADAKQYAEDAALYYNSKKAITVDPLDTIENKIVWDFGSVAKAGDSVRLYQHTMTDDTESNSVKIGWLAYKRSGDLTPANSGYKVWLKNEWQASLVTANEYYAAIECKTDYPAKVTLASVNFGNTSGDNTWEALICYNAIKDDANSTSDLYDCLTFTNTNTQITLTFSAPVDDTVVEEITGYDKYIKTQNYYVRKVIFFANKSDAEAYSAYVNSFDR